MKKIFFIVLFLTLAKFAYAQDPAPVAPYTTVSPNFTAYYKIVGLDTLYYFYSAGKWVQLARANWVKKYEINNQSATAQNASFWIGGNGEVNGTFKVETPPVNNDDVVRLGDLGQSLDGVIAPLSLTVSGTTLTVSPGSWSISGVTYSTTTNSTFTLDAQDPTNSIYDDIYADNTGTLHIIRGTPSVTPVEPTIPTGTVYVGNVFITPQQVVVTNPVTKGLVPYIGAIQNVNIGKYRLIANSLQITATGGGGELLIANQNARPAKPPYMGITDYGGSLAWIKSDNFIRKFVDANTADHSYTLQNGDGILAFTSQIPDVSGFMTLGTPNQTVTQEPTFNAGIKSTFIDGAHTGSTNNDLGYNTVAISAFYTGTTWGIGRNGSFIGIDDGNGTNATYLWNNSVQPTYIGNAFGSLDINGNTITRSSDGAQVLFAGDPISGFLALAAGTNQTVNQSPIFANNVTIDGYLNMPSVSYDINIYNPGVPAQNTTINYTGMVVNSSSGQNSQLSSGGLVVANSGYANLSEVTDNGITAGDVNGFTGYNRNGIGYTYNSLTTTISFAIPTVGVNQTIPALNGTYMLYVSPPASSSDTGLDGQFAMDANYFYWHAGSRWNRVPRDNTF